MKFEDYTPEYSARQALKMITRNTKTPCEHCGDYVTIKNRRQYGREGIRVCPDCYKKLQEQ